MKRITKLLTVALFVASSCESELDKLPLDRPSDANFFSTQNELELAVNGIYNMMYSSPFQTLNMKFHLDNTTDIGWDRDNSGFQNTGNGGHSAVTGIFSGIWNIMYTGIGRANELLANMDRAVDVTPPTEFDQYRGEGMFFRAYFYHHLVMLYGDVPLLTRPQNLESANPSRTDRDEIVSFILSELDEAATLLPEAHSGGSFGRITRASALALRARMALYDGEWNEALISARAVVELGTHSLHPSYSELFSYAGESSPEILLSIRYDLNTGTHLMAPWIWTRMGGGFTNKIPVQALVDSYECTDGLPIDESPLYDPANPFENRDPRLDMTVARSGAEHLGFIFETHPDSVETFDLRSGTPLRVTNFDVTNPFATFSGYAWRKYSDEPRATMWSSQLDFILMRYAEVLLTLAEAKLELGQIDGELLDALNTVRARGYGVDVGEITSYPAVAATDASGIREIIRRERKIELAGEGARLYDLRRWGVADKALTGVLVGRPRGAYELQGVPVFDENGLPDYSAYTDVMKNIEVRQFNSARDFLWPIPQTEIDINSNLTQNPGY